MGMLCVYILHHLPHFKIFSSPPHPTSSLFSPHPLPPHSDILPSRTPQVLSSKRYDLEGFAEYARQLRECQAFQEREGASIGYVLRVHTALGKHGVEVPAQDKVHHVYESSLSPLSTSPPSPFPPPPPSPLSIPFLPLSTSSLSLFLPLFSPSLLQCITINNCTEVAN